MKNITCGLCGKESGTQMSFMGHCNKMHEGRQLKKPNGVHTETPAAQEATGALLSAISILQARATDIRKQLDGMELLEAELTSIQNMLDVHARNNQLVGTSMQHFASDTPIKYGKA